MLVVMALIATLAAIAMVVAPGAMEKDRAATAVSQLQSALQISRARAIRDGLPRGVRLVWNTYPQLTEYQYIESPPVFVPNPGAPTGLTPYAPNAAPYVQFNYAPNSGPPTFRTCTITGLTTDHQAQVTPGGTLYLPTLGTWHQILAVSGTSPMTVTLATYPDEQLGAETQLRTYHFGLYGGPRTLLGEPTLQLPKYTSVDINLSSPAGAANTDYDILFSPSGQLVYTPSTQGAGQVFLWIRDQTKPQPTFGNGATYNASGEMMVLAIKAKSGGIGGAPIDYGADPFLLAKKALSGQ
jgi:type II secretory pathway pseudopilin PulG